MGSLFIHILIYALSHELLHVFNILGVPETLKLLTYVCGLTNTVIVFSFDHFFKSRFYHVMEYKVDFHIDFVRKLSCDAIKIN